MKTLTFVTPSLIGLVVVFAARLDLPAAGDGAVDFASNHATVAAVGCSGCAGCEATYIDVGPSMPGLTIMAVAAIHGADDGLCVVEVPGCDAEAGCTFNDAFMITDNAMNDFVYKIGKHEFIMRQGTNKVLVTDKELPCDQSAAPAFGNTESVCVHTDAASTPPNTLVWARHYICSWCQEN